MNRHDPVPIIGWPLIAFSAALVFGTLRGKHGGGPMLPQLVPVTGIVFVVLMMSGQLLVCAWRKSAVGALCVVILFALGYAAGSFAEERRAYERQAPPNPALDKVLREHAFSPRDYDWTRHKLITGAAFSGVVLGFGVARGKL